MDRQIQILRNVVNRYLNKSKDELLMIMGKPENGSDDEMWFYTQNQAVLFRNEIAFIFENDMVKDIVISEFFLWMLVSNVYFYEGMTPEYKKTTRLGKHIWFTAGKTV